eukprot:SAG11_NODE_260_length_11531_cov_6.271781_6_plen_641_part_00
MVAIVALVMLLQLAVVLGEKEWAPLEAGHAVWSKKQLKASTGKKQQQPLVLVGLTSRSCGAYCEQFEPRYADFTESLSAEYGGGEVLFARIDADKEKALVSKYAVHNLPAILAFKKGQRLPFEYNGVHSAAALLSYTHKLMAPPAAALSTEIAVREMVSAHNETTVVVGFFKSTGSDEYEDWREGAEALAMRSDVQLAELVDPGGELLAKFSEGGSVSRWFRRAPAAVVFRREAAEGLGRTDEDRATVELETLTEGSVERWVDSNSMPSCGLLHALTFNNYERLGLPMLLLFLSSEARDELPKSEKDALAAFCVVSRKYSRRISFLHGDGKEKYREKKKVLGLHGDALPAMAMNTADGRVLTFEGQPFSELAIESFVRSYLGEDLQAKAEGVPRRADSPRPPQPSAGGLKGDAHADAFVEGADNVTVLTGSNFEHLVLDEHKDVLVVLQAHDSASSQEFYKYVKRMTDQFIQLGIETVRVGKFDVEKYVLPPRLGIQYNTLPAVIMFPAKDKELPYIYFTGKAKAQYLMWFVQEHASYRFELPEDPHLTPEQRVMKKQQLRERSQSKYDAGTKAAAGGDDAAAVVAFEEGLSHKIDDDELTALLQSSLAAAKMRMRHTLEEEKGVEGGADEQSSANKGEL